MFISLLARWEQSFISNPALDRTLSQPTYRHAPPRPSPLNPTPWQCDQRRYIISWLFTLCSSSAKTILHFSRPTSSKQSTMSLAATSCTPNWYEEPTPLPAAFCASDMLGNHASVLTTCCDDNNGTISSSSDGCNLFCAIDLTAYNSISSCIHENNGASLCEYNDVPVAYISGTTSTSTATSSATSSVTSSATNTATNSAPSPSQSDSIRLFAPKSLLLGIVFLLTVSIL